MKIKLLLFALVIGIFCVMASDAFATSIATADFAWVFHEAGYDFDLYYMPKTNIQYVSGKYVPITLPKKVVSKVGNSVIDETIDPVNYQTTGIPISAIGVMYTKVLHVEPGKSGAYFLYQDDLFNPVVTGQTGFIIGSGASHDSAVAGIAGQAVQTDYQRCVIVGSVNTNDPSGDLTNGNIVYTAWDNQILNPDNDFDDLIISMAWNRTDPASTFPMVTDRLHGDVATPEPASMLAFGLALLGIGARMRRRK